MLDGQLIELDDVDPTRTVLQFLREDLRRTGTKEGCAEGDCGACTVVVAELCGNDIVAEGHQFLHPVPANAGRQGADHGREPRRRPAPSCTRCSARWWRTMDRSADSARRASSCRCSRCTRRMRVAGRVSEIDDALAGNLCRCTGYRPIIAAAQCHVRTIGR